jgi:hypothetical protein
MKRLNPVVYSLSTLVLVVTLFACNNSSTMIGQNNDPQPGASPSCPPASLTVTIPQGAGRLGIAAYGNNPLVIAAGTSVTWVNQDAEEHTATSDTGVWDTGLLVTGESSMPVRFATVGTFPYSDAINGRQAMSGVIQVIPRPAGCPMPAVSPTPSEAGAEEEGGEMGGAGGNSSGNGAEAGNGSGAPANPAPAPGNGAVH